MTVYRSTHDLLDRLGQTLEELLAVERHVLKRLEGIETELLERGGGSSIEIDSNGKAGEPKIKVKRYDDSNVPVRDALADYAEAKLRLEEGSLAGWQETLEAIERQRAS